MPSTFTRKLRLQQSEPIRKVIDSARDGKLVVVIGTGISTALTNGAIPSLSWKGLIVDGFEHCVRKGRITERQAQNWKAQLDSCDIDDLLAAAEFMGRKLDAPHGDLYARWLQNVFESVEPANKKMAKAISALHHARIPLCTLNYDPLLERVTGLPALTLTDTRAVAAWIRRETEGVLHLHGSWDAPTTCILGIRDYETTRGNELRDFFQRSLSSLGRLLFIGCGDTFSDPNFSALAAWLREHMKVAAPEHYALVVNSDARTRHADSTWQGFVEPVGYGDDRANLPDFLLNHFSGLRCTGKAKVSREKAPAPIASHAALLNLYRSFLLRDSGLMTIEGVRAKGDIAERRFELERLFVPLELTPTPPDIPEADPDREQKLLAWQEKNKQPVPFGDVFAKHRRLALLALPGGGKSLLLKRVAVAYAEPARRAATSDLLPKLDLVPVLIRCREWREHLHRPILTMLKHLPDVSGQPSLAGISDALVPLLKKGRILFLVDGLDEIHEDALRATFVDHLEQFLDEYKRIRFVVTSREAGFGLVAPTLARFCERWRVAPLKEESIVALCAHWHSLMIGDSAEADVEAKEVSDSLLQSESLRRLAENPLLLTMLLVVKHGAGRLPPDRVSLYSRAVEVLLDTWNIKGHAPLNMKEAVPQLACVAFELMRQGAQTATESELLSLLERAREKISQIRLYAKDTPQDFLRRVELRSSLLFEAGRQAFGTGTVPFYQFRHLTFQEYLAAVAAVEGYYLEYHGSHRLPLTPLEPYLTTEEWKEVIPMAAVLGKKQAQPLLRVLAQAGEELRRCLQSGEDFAGRGEWQSHPQKLPAPISRLVQCLVEEAEAPSETLTSALRAIAVFAQGCNSLDNWKALSRGPYGEQLLLEAWQIYTSMQVPLEAGLRHTCVFLSTFRNSEAYWRSSAGLAELEYLLKSEVPEEIGRGLLTSAGLAVFRQRKDMEVLLPAIEEHLFQEDPALWSAAAYAWAALYHFQRPPDSPPRKALDRMLSVWLQSNAPGDSSRMGALALSEQFGLPRDVWRPTLTDHQRQQLRVLFEKEDGFPDVHYRAACVVAFHSRDVWTERDLADKLKIVRDRVGSVEDLNRPIEAMIKQIGELGGRRRPADMGKPRRQGVRRPPS